MRKIVILLAVAAVAVSPSLALAKAKHHAAHHAKATKTAKAAKPQAGPNDNTFHLLSDMVAGK